MKKQFIDTRPGTVMLGLVLIAGIMLLLFLLFGCNSKPTHYVVDKTYLPGYRYTMRAQTGAKTLTMPAYMPPVCKIEILTDSAGQRFTAWETVSLQTYQHVQKLQYLNQ